jgi:hypothetical protein
MHLVHLVHLTHLAQWVHLIHLAHLAYGVDLIIHLVKLAHLELVLLAQLILCCHLLLKLRELVLVVLLALEILIPLCPWSLCVESYLNHRTFLFITTMSSPSSIGLYMSVILLVPSSIVSCKLKNPFQADH